MKDWPVDDYMEGENKERRRGKLLAYIEAE